MRSCDTSTPLPNGINQLLEKMADQYRERYCCWQLRSQPAGVTVFSGLFDIYNSGSNQGVFNDAGDLWGIFSYDKIINGNISDFETYIYTGTGIPIPAAASYSMRKSVIDGCRRKCEDPSSSSRSKITKDRFIPQPNTPLRSPAPLDFKLSYNIKENWYKKAQANNFNPEMLNDVKNLDKFTQEQWQAARDWASKQPQWVESEDKKANWGSKQPAVDILYNNEEFNRRKNKAPMGAAIASESNSGVEVIRRFIPTITGSLGVLNNQVATYANEGATCPANSEYYPSNDPASYSNIAGIDKAISIAFAAVTQASAQAINFNNRRFLGSPANNSRLLTIICNAQKHALKIQEQAPAMIAYIDSALKDTSHIEHGAAKNLIAKISGGGARAGAIPMASGPTRLT